jgi:hypothetical protein
MWLLALGVACSDSEIKIAIAQKTMKACFKWVKEEVGRVR